MISRRMPLMELSDNDATSAAAAAANRRKSGRAVRAPEFFAEPSAKRKRGARGGDGENGVSDPEDDESSSSEDEESAGEDELKDAKRRAKAAGKRSAKKVKTNGAARSAQSMRLPNRPKKGRKAEIADQDAEGLYADVFVSGDNSKDVATSWLKRYENDAAGAMTDLVNCVLRSAGCSLTVTEDDIRDPDNVPNRLADLQDEYQTQSIHEYPLISKAKGSHVFRQSLTGFFQWLLMAMHETGSLYDDPALIENIHLWVTTMSSSVLRPFRHTATVISLAMVESLCNIAKDLADVTAKTLRQLDGEQKKKTGNKGRVAAFQQKVDEGTQKREMCENNIKDFFDTVFVHRYRDVDPRVRTECVEALGDWILTLPDVFLDGSYLRYLGWMLSDTHWQTRQEVIKQLEKIMKNRDMAGGLRSFIERFCPRLVEMAMQDSEASVRSSAIDILDMIRQEGMLEPDDIDKVGKLIFDSEARVRRAVVGFFAANINDSFASKVEELGGEEVLEETLNPDEEDFESPRPAWVKLKALAEILVAYDFDEAEETSAQPSIGAGDVLNASTIESRFSVAAQAVADKIPEIREWQVLAGYLLFDHSKKATGNSTERAIRNAFRLNEDEEVILLDVLNTSVKVGLLQSEDSDRTKRRRNLQLESADDQESIATHLANLIPRLLKKFGARPKSATAVLRLEHALNLGVFQELRQDSTAYSKLLDEITTQFSGHADQAVLNEASAALLHARSFEELEEITESKVQTLWEDTLSSLRHIAGGRDLSIRGNLSIPQLKNLSSTMARLQKLSAISDCTDIFDSDTGTSRPAVTLILSVAARGVLEEADPEIDELEDEIVSSAVRTLILYFMWKVRSLKETAQNREPIEDAAIDRVNEYQNTFANSLIGALSSRAGLDDLRLLATGTLLDLRTLFSTLRASSGVARYQYLQGLIQEIAPEIQGEITSIFAGAERQFAKKAKKSLEAPADDDEPEDLDSEPEDEDDDDVSAAERQAETLKAEQRLCELTGKLVLAILACVIDSSGPMKGKLRTRIQRNRNKLGHNFKEVVAYLDESSKAERKQKPKVLKPSEKLAKSTERVDDEEEDEPEEGTEEDLRRRGLLDEPASDEEHADEGAAGAGDDDESILGD